MTNQPRATAQWRKSSYSNGTGGECVEVAEFHSTVGIRDSKQPLGPRIAVGNDAWVGFIASLHHQGETGN